MNTAQIAEALLLAMDGDFLPGAGMGVDNQGRDVPLDKARPKEVAWWAAEAIAGLFAAHNALVRGAWDEGYAASASDARWVEGTSNPYRLHDLDEVAAEFGVDLNDNEEKAMKVHVYDSNGSKAEYDADDLETEGSELWVKKGDAIVAVYAPSKWINADVITDAEHA